jgi:hypothetical protein
MANFNITSQPVAQRPDLGRMLHRPQVGCRVGDGAPPVALGRPLGVKAVAKLIGCSAWTVRQKLVPLGIPYFRPSPKGKFLFYEAEVIAWIAARQGGRGR